MNHQNDQSEWLIKLITDRCDEIINHVKIITAIRPDDDILKDKLDILKDLETITETRMRKKV